MFRCNYFIKQLRNSFQGKITSSMCLRCSPTFGFDLRLFLSFPKMLQRHARMDDTVLNRKALVLFYFLIFLYVLKCDPNFTKRGTKNYAKQFNFLLRVLRSVHHVYDFHLVQFLQRNYFHVEILSTEFSHRGVGIR